MDYFLGILTGFTAAGWLYHERERRKAEASAGRSDHQVKATATRLEVTWEDLEEADRAVEELKRETRL